jgi:hypothetical protein
MRAAIAVFMTLLGAAAWADAPKPPRLAGTVVSDGERLAIFVQDSDSAWTLAHEGDAQAPYRVQSIEPGRVIVLGPQGALTLRVEEDHADRQAQAPSAASRLTPVEQGATDLGLTAGRAAARYDNCIHQGLLNSDNPASAFSRLQAVVAAMAGVPPVTDPNGFAVTQPGAMAEWIRVGAERAMRGDTSVRDRADCETAARAWNDVAGRLGAR